MSDIFQQDIFDPNPPSNMQQVPATHIHNIEGNEATDPHPTSPSLKVEEDERVDENGPGSLSPPNSRPVSKGTDGNPTLDTSSLLGEYEEIQSQLDEMEGEDDSSEGFYKLLREDAEAYLEPTDFCLFEQLPPLWSYIQKRGKNVGFQTLGMIGDTQKVLEIPLNERNELIKALD
ncbi:hypothetical protein P9112_008566 [Eukaryota sp. TZLM1-RC]